MLVEEYVAVDLEMTGIYPGKDEIIEIGAVKVKKDGITTFHTLVCPNQQIPERVIQLTGITNEMAKEGMQVDDAMKAYLEFSEDLPLLGHHVISDYSFLKQWALTHEISYERIGVDTLKLARRFLPELEKKTLSYLAKYYDISVGNNHSVV